MPTSSVEGGVNARWHLQMLRGENFEWHTLMQVSTRTWLEVNMEQRKQRPTITALPKTGQ